MHAEFCLKNIKGERQFERRGRKWEFYIKIQLREIGLLDVEWIDFVHNKNR